MFFSSLFFTLFFSLFLPILFQFLLDFRKEFSKKDRNIYKFGGVVLPKTSNTTNTTKTNSQNRNRKQTTKTQTQKRNTSSSRKPAPKNEERMDRTENRGSEVWGIFCMALGIVFIIALVLAGKNPEEAGFAGAIGGFFVKIAVWVAGRGKFFLAIALFLWGALIFRGKQYAWLGKKSLGLFLIFVAVLGFCNAGIAFDKDFSAFITNSITPQVIDGTMTEANPVGVTKIVGGGYFGATISFVARWAFGDIGAFVILVALILIGALLLTGVSLSELFAALSLKAKETAVEIKKAEREDERKREEERARQLELKKRLLMEEAALAKKEPDEWFHLDGKKPLIVDHNEKAHAPLISEPKEQIDAGKVPLENAFAREFLPKLSDVKGEGATNAGEQQVPLDNPVFNDFEVENRENSPAIVGIEPVIQDREQEEASEAAEPVSSVFSPMGQLEEEGGETVANSNAAVTSSSSASAEQNEESTVSAVANGAADGEENPYVLPSPELLTAGINTKSPRMNAVITENIGKLEQTLKNFGISAKVTQVVAGPAVVRYELQPAPGVKVSKIVNLSDDIALGLAATQVRIEAPVPGKSVVGIEVPKGEITTVYFRDVIESENFQKSKSKISIGFGKDISGDCLVGDLAKMPHLMIAGATGSGKSVCINTLICSILYKATPKEVKFLLVDPKKVELSQYAGLPHLIAPVVTDPKKAAAALKWVVNEMENRYSLFAGNMVKDFGRYNELHPEAPLPQIVVLIDELADLMMVAARDVEDAICRLAQMARAAGIHLVIATQRPSVDVITGLIKANIPSRIAFAVSSQIDSRTILDMAGAERLLGKGDMLYYPTGMAKPLRVQGAIIFEQDIQNLVNYCKNQCKPEYLDPVVDVTTHVAEEKVEETDPLFMEAVRLVLTAGQASTSFLQRRMRIGNPRAGRLIDIMEQNGIVGPSEGAKARNILITLEEFEERFGSTQNNA